MPLSDDEEDAARFSMPQGVDRQGNAFIMQAVFERLGSSEEVVRITAKQLKLPVGEHTSNSCQSTQ